MLARMVAWLPGVDAGFAVVLVANVCALAVGFLLFELVMRRGERRWRSRGGGVDRLPRALAFVLVMGYAEALFMIAAAVALLALRRRTWWVAAVAGVVAGLTRPVGVLLAVPALVEAFRARKELSAGDRIGAVASVLAPAVGTGAYLAWAEHRTGDLFYPLRVQQRSTSAGRMGRSVPRGVARRE